ncbi:MAG: Abi family protein [Agitococcus sp.]|nr:Abi family protein [Agitococcus sp.]
MSLPNKIPFNKPPLTFAKQLQLLKSRGMIVNDDNKALNYLGQLNYYRLGAYWLPFEQSHQSHQFLQGTTFERVVDLYVFDRELRLLVLDAIERVEVSVRTRWAYILAHTHGTHAHTQASIFKPTWSHSTQLQKLEDEYQQSQEKFVQHLRNKHSESVPPLWVQVELFSFGQLSKWLANLTSSTDRNAICRHYGFDEVYFVSFMHHLTTIRNICAHHGRLWNRDLTVTFKLPSRNPQRLVPALNNQQTRKLYNTLATLAFLLDGICIGHHWRKRLIDLIDKHQIDVAAMGFPSTWRTLPFWAT